MVTKNIKTELSYSDKTHKYAGLAPLFAALFDHIDKRMKPAKPLVESLTLLKDAEMKKYNATYRGIDRPTDVLSFGFNSTGKPNDLPFWDLGEVLISTETALRQAAEFKHPFARELSFLFIHGTLHNMGYDHEREKEAEAMFALQNELLNSFSWDWSKTI